MSAPRKLAAILAADVAGYSRLGRTFRGTSFPQACTGEHATCKQPVSRRCTVATLPIRKLPTLLCPTGGWTSCGRELGAKYP